MAQYELNIKDCHRIIKKRAGLMFLIFAAVLISSIVYSNTQTPRYLARAYIQWIPQEASGQLLRVKFGWNVPTPAWLLYNNLQTQRFTVTSLPILERVVLGLGLANKNMRQAEVTKQANALKNATSVDVIFETNILRVNVIYSEPEKAALIANKIAEIYIAESLNKRTMANRLFLKAVEKRLEEISNKLRDLEDALERLKEEKGQLRSQSEYYRLQREIEINSNLYKEFRDKLENALLDEETKQSELELIDPAVSPPKPFSLNNKPLNYLLGAILGLMLGLAVIFIIEKIDSIGA